MSRKHITRWAGGLLSAMVFLAANPAVAGVADTKHNLSTSGTGSIVSTDESEICVFCHTPHDAIKNDNIPLWNHTLSSEANYGVYTSPTFDGTDAVDLGGVTEATAAVSNLCLSCHDGTVAVNSLNNPSNSLGANPTMLGGIDTVSGSMNLSNGDLAGEALKNDHPVNFTYSTTLATTDGSLVDPVDATGSGLTNAKLFAGKVQCASCHDPHESDPLKVPFLRASMDASGLCMECHIK